MNRSELSERDYEELLDHGTWTYGLLPNGEETAVIVHNGNVVESYQDRHRDYRETVFSGAMEQLGGSRMVESGAVYDARTEREYEWDRGELEYIGNGLHAGFKWQEWPFVKELRAGRIEIEAPVLIKSYLNDVLVHEDWHDDLREKFINYCQQSDEERAAHI